MQTFTQTVKAENFPEKIHWTLRDSLVLCIIPITICLGYGLTALGVSKLNVDLIDCGLRGLIFFILLGVYRPMLKQHWSKFVKSFWRSMLLVVTAAVVLQLIISYTRILLPVVHMVQQQEYDTVAQPIFTTLLISLLPLFTVLIEDIIFRYTLLHKLFVNPLLWRVFILLANSILFGLIHFQNFSGNLVATISYMTAGLFLNLIYVWTKNIWHVLLIHFLNNAALSLFATIVLAIIS